MRTHCLYAFLLLYWKMKFSSEHCPFNILAPDLLHMFSYLPRDLNFLEHSSDIGWKEWVWSSCSSYWLLLFSIWFTSAGSFFCCRAQRARPIIIDPGLYHAKKSGVFYAKERRSLPASFKLFMGIKAHPDTDRTKLGDVWDFVNCMIISLFLIFRSLSIQDRHGWCWRGSSSTSASGDGITSLELSSCTTLMSSHPQKATSTQSSATTKTTRTQQWTMTFITSSGTTLQSSTRLH